ncbi:NDR1/HIN1-like protein 6 [Pistacia vera]|uniref:Uncharacterized protein n=1 Tax=Pistacia integerrima TaxID=434235 RepID=A0ACC0WXT2_9ROSI|nr:NDR1/HIN1-like protein 6 [Pistacia vera]KAJ0006848.1 hypothetical protein Pint_28950 [Pistacia integerrima]
MADRVYPSAKQNINGANPAFPATKSQLYGANRPTYRPTPRRHRYRRSCCCSCCLWITLTIIFLVFLVAIAGAIIYVLYRPHRPSFSVSSLKITTLNLTSSSTLVTNINLNVTAKNPNKELVYYYDPISISLLTNDDEIAIGSGSFPAFVHGTKNTTLLKTSIKGNSQALDDASASKIKSEMKSKSGLPLKIKLETKMKVKMGAIKSPKVRIRVSCDGIRATVPTGKTATTASTSNAKCKVDWRIKIWKWTF